MKFRTKLIRLIENHEYYRRTDEDTAEDYRKFYRNGDLYLASKGYTSRAKFLEQVEKARECEMI